jgi:hypothetical protein
MLINAENPTTNSVNIHKQYGTQTFPDTAIFSALHLIKYMCQHMTNKNKNESGNV